MLKFLTMFAGTVLAASATVQAAELSIVSMRYSAAHPVPHIHYEGDTTAGDVAALRQIFTSFVHCRDSCSGPDGMPNAVLTMNGPGGDYVEGLALADFLRENHIATVVERGAQCYSACAFAFLGGSAWSSQERLGTYIDRMVEPGSVVGFHAPYADADSFARAMTQIGAMATQGETRSNLALMVKELVKWNVDPEVLFYMVGKGPDETYNLLAADDLYLARVALPPTPTMSWITDIPSAVRNACARLLAIDEHGDPMDMRDRIPADFIENIGRTRFDGAISGYKLGERVLDIGSCSVTETSLQTGGDLDVALYFTPGIEFTTAAGTSTSDPQSAPKVEFINAPGTSMFNRQNGWSTAGVGHNPLKRILQKGALNHFFLPMGVPIDDLNLPGEAEVDKNRYNMRLPPLLPSLPAGLTVDTKTASSRVSHVGDVWVFERVGPKLLFDTTVADPLLGRTIATSVGNTVSFSRTGVFDDTGTAFATFGFLDATAAVVIDVLVVKGDGNAATAEDLRIVQQIQCGTTFNTMRLSCS